MAGNLDTDVVLDNDFTQQTGGGVGATTPTQPTFVTPSGVSSIGQSLITAPSAAAARAILQAAASGANADINTFSALTGVSGWNAWTGTPDKTSHTTYAATAGVAYDQAQIQSLMDKVKELSEMNKALLDALLASGNLQ